MDKKERYEWDGIEGVEWIRDTEMGYLLNYDDMKKVADLLNQQSKRIKELEEELDDAKRDYIPKLEFGLQRANKMGRDAEKENQQLKQQLHDLPKKIVSEIRKNIGSKLYRIIPEGEYGSRLGIDWCEINRILDTILKKYGGEDESNND